MPLWAIILLSVVSGGLVGAAIIYVLILVAFGNALRKAL